MEFQDLALKLDVRVEQEKKRRAKEEEKFEKKRNEERAALQKEPTRSGIGPPHVSIVQLPTSNESCQQHLRHQAQVLELPL